MKLTVKQLQEAAQIAEEIGRLEALRDSAEDATVVVQVGSPTPQAPMGAPGLLAALQINGVKVSSDRGVVVTVPATSIRAALVDKLAPLYTQLRNLGIELQL